MVLTTQQHPVSPKFPKEAPLGMPTFSTDVLFTASARHAWYLLLNWYREQGGRGDVLLPAYIGRTEREGSGVFDPVQESGLTSRFYPVNGSLELSTEQLRLILEQGNVGVMLLVHWFGLPHADLDQVRALCCAHQVLLVEDCAHVPWPMANAHISPGRVGDAAIYSFHKVYGGDSGGALVWNREREAKGSIQVAQTCPSSVLEDMLRSNLPAIFRHRQGLYQDYVAGLKNIDGLRVMYPEIGNHVPHDCPVLIEDGLRQPLYFALMEEGIPLTALYYRLIDEIEEARFPHGFGVSRSILNFPVHQGVSADMASHIIETTSRLLGELRD
jgi:dTDP-4-amino-4,6-dideoxygalactose transaminase